jgi:hypothetical protein
MYPMPLGVIPTGSMGLTHAHIVPAIRQRQKMRLAYRSLKSVPIAAGSAAAILAATRHGPLSTPTDGDGDEAGL